MSSTKQPSFWDHLEELRTRLIRAALFLVFTCVVAFQYMDHIMPIVIKPAGHLVFTAPTDAFNAYVTMSIISGFIITSPYLCFEIWAFIRNGLTPNERRLVYFFAPLSLVLFLSGVGFAFFVAVPMAYQFLMSFSSDALVAMVTIDKYMTFVGQMVIAFGAAFQLPLILAFLAKIGVATPAFLIHMRRYSYLIIFIFAAILTPPDVMSQILLAVPLIVLYELGIVLMKMVIKHKTL